MNFCAGKSPSMDSSDKEYEELLAKLRLAKDELDRIVMKSKKQSFKVKSLFINEKKLVHGKSIW